MKQKLNKTIQKMALILLCILSFNFIAPTYVSNAADIGGVLFSPIKSLLVGVGDIAMSALDLGVTGTWSSVIKKDVLDGDYDPDTDSRKGKNLWEGYDYEIDLPKFRLSPEAIFGNDVELLNIDFINPIDESEYSVKNKETTSSLKDLRKVIASWYVAIRKLALVAMLSILVYVGIKIIISSTASDKAKYKQMLVDWVIGMCLLFMLHYIMAFTLFITESITDIIKESSGDIVEFNNPKGKNGKTGPIKFNDNIDDYYNSDGEFWYNGKAYAAGDELKGLQNLTAYARFYIQLKDGMQSFAYLIVYWVLIIYTIWFAIIYLKRVLTVAFLTMIAPFVAMTYPLDKINDGKAQAFNFWLKEYLMNALIQPFHLILYTVLIGSSVKLATNNLIYALVAMGFLIPAEKLLRKMFGLDRASTPPGLGGALAAGAGSQVMKNLLSKAGKGKTNIKAGTGGNGSAEASTGSIRSKNNYDFSGINAKNLPEPEGFKNNNEIPMGLEEAADGTLALAANQVANDEFKNKNEQQNDDSYRNNLTNNQNAELDAYMNSPAYGNNDSKEDEKLKEDNKLKEQRTLNDGNEKTKENDNKSKKEYPKGTARKMARLAWQKGRRSAVRAIKNPKTWKTLAKGVTKGAGMAVLGTAGLAAGIASGSPSKAFGLAAAGVAAGNKLGGSVVDTAANIGGGITGAAQNVNSSFKDLRNEAAFGYDYAQDAKKERKLQQQAKEFKNNRANQKYFEEKTGKYGEDLKGTMNQAAYYNQFQGFEENDTKLKAIELENYYKEQGIEEEYAKTLVKASQNMASSNEYKKSDFNKSETYMDEVYNKGGQSLDESSREKMAGQLMIGAKYMKGMTNKPENVKIKKPRNEKTTPKENTSTNKSKNVRMNKPGTKK